MSSHANASESNDFQYLEDIAAQIKRWVESWNMKDPGNNLDAARASFYTLIEILNESRTWLLRVEPQAVALGNVGEEEDDSPFADELWAAGQYNVGVSKGIREHLSRLSEDVQAIDSAFCRDEGAERLRDIQENLLGDRYKERRTGDIHRVLVEGGMDPFTMYSNDMTDEEISRLAGLVTQLELLLDIEDQLVKLLDKLDDICRVWKSRGY